MDYAISRCRFKWPAAVLPMTRKTRNPSARRVATAAGAPIWVCHHRGRFVCCLLPETLEPTDQHLTVYMNTVNAALEEVPATIGIVLEMDEVPTLGSIAPTRVRSSSIVVFLSPMGTARDRAGIRSYSGFYLPGRPDNVADPEAILRGFSVAPLSMSEEQFAATSNLTDAIEPPGSEKLCQSDDIMKRGRRVALPWDLDLAMHGRVLQMKFTAYELDELKPLWCDTLSCITLALADFARICPSRKTSNVCIPTHGGSTSSARCTSW